MEFTIKSNVDKVFDEAENKVTFFSLENDNELVVITDEAGKFFSSLEIATPYNLQQCAKELQAKLSIFKLEEIEGLFQEVIASLDKTGFVEIN